jgi:hypothetical protein
MVKVYVPRVPYEVVPEYFVFMKNVRETERIFVNCNIKQEVNWILL